VVASTETTTEDNQASCRRLRKECGVMVTYKDVFAGSIVLAFVLAGVGYGSAQIVEGEYLIVMEDGESLPADLDQAVVEAGGEVACRIPEIGVAIAASAEDRFAKAMVEYPNVEIVLPQLMVEWLPYDAAALLVDEAAADAASIGDDEPFFGFQWALDVIDAPEAWDAGWTGAGVRVAVLDTGVDWTHLDLMGQIDGASISFVPFEPFIDDLDGHGTHVAGIIAAADNGFGTIGVAPGATVIAVKVLSGSGWGAYDWILQGIVYAASPYGGNADVINMSLCGSLFKSDAKMDKWIPHYLSTFNRAVNFARGQGAVVISAAGNDAIDLDHNRDEVVLPAEAGNGMAVSATGPVGQANFDNPASYTNFGKSAIDVAAPGGDAQLFPAPGWHLDMVFSTYPGGWAWTAGTSVAAPHVAGVAALLIEANGGQMHPAQVKAVIEQSAEDLGKRSTDAYYGRGRINAYSAVTHR
jgi:subtilisin family serine protease